MEFSQRQEYYEANRRMLDAVVEAFERTLIVDTDRVLLYKHGSQDAFNFVEGQYSPDEMLDLGPKDEDDWESPVERAREQNEAIVRDANRSLRYVRIAANVLRTDGLAPTHDVVSLGVAQVPIEHAVFRRIDFDDEDDGALRGKVSAIEVITSSESSQGSSGAFYELLFARQGVAEVLRMVVINGKTEFVDVTLKPAKDDLYDRCYDMFGPYSKAMDLLFGRFETTDELESALNSIRTATAGIYPNHVLDALLRDLAEGAVLRKEKDQFIRTTALNMPSNDKLEDFIEFLGTLEP